MDISSAYLYQNYHHKKPVFVRQHPRFDGSLKHPCKGGKLIKNIYGTPPAARIYYDELVAHLKHKYQPAQADPCLFHKHNDQGSIIIAVSRDDFLSIASDLKLHHQLYIDLSRKYKVKRLGFLTNYQTWTITKPENQSIHISQPVVIATILEKARMTTCNPKPTPPIQSKFRRGMQIRNSHLAASNTVPPNHR